MNVFLISKIKRLKKRHRRKLFFDENEFKQRSLRAIRRKKIISKVLFYVLMVVALIIISIVLWAYLIDTETPKMHYI